MNVITIVHDDKDLRAIFVVACYRLLFCQLSDSFMGRQGRFIALLLFFYGWL